MSTSIIVHLFLTSRLTPIKQWTVPILGSSATWKINTIWPSSNTSHSFYITQKKTCQRIRDTFVCVKRPLKMTIIPSCVSSIIISQTCINFTRSMPMLWCWFILYHLICANYMNKFFKCLTRSQLGATFCHQLTTAIVPGQSTKGFMAIEPFNTRMRIRKSSLGSARVMVDPRRGLHVYDLPRGPIKLHHFEKMSLQDVVLRFSFVPRMVESSSGLLFLHTQNLKLVIFLCLFYGNHRSTNISHCVIRPFTPNQRHVTGCDTSPVTMVFCKW